jgi:hypothetical protein
LIIDERLIAIYYFVAWVEHGNNQERSNIVFRQKSIILCVLCSIFAVIFAVELLEGLRSDVNFPAKTNVNDENIEAIKSHATP